MPKFPSFIMPDRNIGWRKRARHNPKTPHHILKTLILVGTALILSPFTLTDAQAGIEAHDGRLKIRGDILAPDLHPFLTAFGTAIRHSADTGKPLRVELNSDGGDIETAFFMAEIIATAQKSGRNIQMEVPEGARCNSACVVIFAAGGQRKAAPNSEFLLHGVTYTGTSETPAIAAIRQRYVENFHKAIEGADWQFGQFVRRHGIIENDLNMSFSGRQLYEAFGRFITSLDTTPAH